MFAARLKQTAELAQAATDKGVKMSVAKAHVVLGHSNKATANYLGWNLVGTDATCESCATAKAHQKNLGQGSGKCKEKTPFEKVHLDLSSVKKKDKIPYTSRPVWRLIVDSFTVSI